MAHLIFALLGAVIVPLAAALTGYGVQSVAVSIWIGSFLGLLISSGLMARANA